MSMFKAKYYKADGSKGRARGLPDELFDGVINEPVLHRVVKALQANKRQGTAAAKNRSAVAGGSRKPWRQKGTGRARQGTNRAAQWAGGGRAFPPQPHGWHQKVPRKVRALARRSALNARAQEDRVVLVDGFDYPEPKTSRLVGFLTGIEAEGKVLILTHGAKPNLYLSARNVPGVEVRPFGDESVYDLLWAGTLIIEREALEAGAAAPPAEKNEKAEKAEKATKATKAAKAAKAAKPETESTAAAGVTGVVAAAVVAEAVPAEDEPEDTDATDGDADPSGEEE